VDEQDIKEKSDEFFTTFDIVCLIHSNADLIVSNEISI
jgi:hypothetical protein